MVNTKTDSKNISAKKVSGKLSKDCIQFEKFFEDFKDLKGKLDNKETVLKFLDTCIEFNLELEKAYCSRFSEFCNSDRRYKKADKYYSSIEKLDNICWDFSQEEMMLLREILDNKKSDLELILDNECGFCEERLRLLKAERNWCWRDQRKFMDIKLKYTKKNVTMKKFLLDMKINNLEFQEGEVIVNNIYNLQSLLTIEDRVKRLEIWKRLYSILHRDAYYLGTRYRKLLQMSEEMADFKIRKNKLAYEVGLNNFDILDVILPKVKTRLDVNHKYYKLRKRLLGLNELQQYDSFVKIVSPSSFKLYDSKEIKYVYVDAVSVLGKQYQSDLKKLFKSKNVIDNNMKSFLGMTEGEEFSIYKKYDGKIDSIIKLVSDFGLIMNYNYANQNDLFNTKVYNVLMKEAFSMVNVLLFLLDIIENDKELNRKVIAIEFLIDMLNKSLVQMFEEIEFKKWLLNQEGETIVNNFNLKYIELEEEYCGDALESHEYKKRDWILRFNPEYLPENFKNSIALMIAISIVKNLRTKGIGYQRKYFEALKAETRVKFNDILKSLEIDLYSDEFVNSAFDVYDYIIDRYEENAFIVKEKQMLFELK